MTTHRHRRGPTASPPSISPHRRRSGPRTSTFTPLGGGRRRRSIARSTRLATRPRSSPAMLRRGVMHPLHVVAVVLAGHRALGARRRRRGAGADWPPRRWTGMVSTCSTEFIRCDRDLDLHLVADAGLRVGPVVRHDEAARRRGRRRASGRPPRPSRRSARRARGRCRRLTVG